MSFKIFCDVCEKPIKGESDRVRRILGEVMIEIMVRYKGTWNSGHVCEHCTIKVVKDGRRVMKNESLISDQLKYRNQSALVQCTQVDK